MLGLPHYILKQFYLPQQIAKVLGNLPALYSSHHLRQRLQRAHLMVAVSAERSHDMLSAINGAMSKDNEAKDLEGLGLEHKLTSLESLRTLKPHSEGEEPVKGTERGSQRMGGYEE
jgi:hypothetical protein